jgi:hypothetical protein
MGDEILTEILKQVTAHGTTISAINAKMDTLVGNGHDGRIDIIESKLNRIVEVGSPVANIDSKRIDVLEDKMDGVQATKNRVIGANGVFAAIVGCWEIFKWKFHL